MGTRHILLLCILGQVLLTSVICTSSIGPDECCFAFYPRRLNKNLVRSYEMTDYRCTKSGIILLTNKNRTICVDPNLNWVMNIMKSVDERTF
ncbi:C-C motif chemokine 18-like [Centropristis striata]|uniref:C-C motif chemokine 18-like n=1 Tax=Centropristis striata TaxID=184440 RepID=UPI0027E0508E|nr:C-C motif chemokine 18-like [Centropristis striata]